MPDRDPTCSVTNCPRPADGVLTLATPSGGFRVSACGEHGERARRGEWLVHDVLGSKYALGGGTRPPVRYERLPR